MPNTRLGRALSLLALAATSLGAQRAPTRDTLYLTHFDVGQGDATLITTWSGKRILIDAGTTGAHIAQRLRAAGIDTLDLLIATHNHLDHIGGIPDVFNALVVRAYMDNGVPTTTRAYQTVLALAAREEGLKYLQATDRTVTVGDVTLKILPPARLDTSQNNNSVGVLVEYGQFRALYTGDSQTEELDAWVGQKRIPRVHVLKAAHHGSINGFNQRLQAAALPALVILSAGAGNNYGHPDPAVIGWWTNYGARTYRTDRDGTVQVNALRDGSFTVRTFPQARGRTR